MELSFNNEPEAGISVLMRNGELTGTKTFSVADSTVTLTALQMGPSSVDLVGTSENKPDGSPDVAGTLTLAVTSKRTAAASTVSLSDFKLTGDLNGDVAAFTLTGTANIEDVKGGTLTLLSGPVALTSLDARQKWHLEADQNRYIAWFEHGGAYPVELHFNAAVTKSNDWRAVDFHVATSALQPVVLQGLAADTEFHLASAARPANAPAATLSAICPWTAP